MVKNTVISVLDWYAGVDSKIKIGVFVLMIIAVFAYSFAFDPGPSYSVWEILGLFVFVIYVVLYNYDDIEKAISDKVKRLLIGCAILLFGSFIVAIVASVFAPFLVNYLMWLTAVVFLLFVVLVMAGNILNI